MAKLKWNKTGPIQSNKEHIDGQWAREFRCKLCGHIFDIGDYWYFVHTIGKNSDAIKNFFICDCCDNSDIEYLIYSAYYEKNN